MKKRESPAYQFLKPTKIFIKKKKKK